MHYVCIGACATNTATFRGRYLVKCGHARMRVWQLARVCINHAPANILVLLWFQNVSCLSVSVGFAEKNPV